MNLRGFFIRVLIIGLPLIFITGSCKKKKAFKEENGQSAEDMKRVQSQNNEVVNDINVAIMEQSLMRGKGTDLNSVTTELCGVDIDTLLILKGITRLIYNGNLCDGVKKTGQIIISLTEYPLKKWKYPGCVVKIDFIAYKVTGPDGKSVQIDGTEYLENESGNSWYNMRYLNATNLIQIQTGDNLKITFDDAHTAIYNINRRITFNYSTASKITSCRIDGLGSSNGVSNLDNWGQNQDGDNFTTTVISPLVWKSNCGSRAPLEGEVHMKVEGKEFEIKCLYGIDEEGNSVAESTTCPFGWKLSWSYKRKTLSRIIAYN